MTRQVVSSTAFQLLFLAAFCVSWQCATAASCDETPTGFEVTASLGSPAAVSLFQCGTGDLGVAEEEDDIVALGYTRIASIDFGVGDPEDPAEILTVTTSSRTWSIDPTGLTGFEDYVLALQTGASPLPAAALRFSVSSTPYDWVAFKLNGVTSGSWQVPSTLQHASLYAAQAVPLPPALWLFASALATIALIAWPRTASPPSDD